MHCSWIIIQDIPLSLSMSSKFFAAKPHTVVIRIHDRDQSLSVCWWCSCGKDQAPHPHKLQSTTSTCLPLAQGQARGTRLWIHQPWVHIHSGMSVTATMGTTRIASACDVMTVGRRAVSTAMQVLLVACRPLGGTPCLLCTPSRGPCLQVVSCILAWAQADPPFLAARCPQGCKHSPNHTVQLSCISRHQQTRLPACSGIRIN